MVSLSLSKPDKPRGRNELQTPLDPHSLRSSFASHLTTHVGCKCFYHSRRVFLASYPKIPSSDNQCRSGYGIGNISFLESSTRSHILPCCGVKYVVGYLFQGSTRRSDVEWQANLGRESGRERCCIYLSHVRNGIHYCHRVLVGFRRICLYHQYHLFLNHP